MTSNIFSSTYLRFLLKSERPEKKRKVSGEAESDFRLVPDTFDLAS